uniref:Putative RNA binding domain protein n=2 Tax=viral metagenome TaxID=1070528 RepID=A0A6M3JRT9_9ZZZZ
MPEKKVIPMFEVASSNIKAIGYHPGSLTLRIQFKAGGTYDYVGVAPAIFSAVMNSDSQGRFFFTKIKGKYECTKREDL